MGNAWIFPSFSHRTGKCNKTHGMGKVSEIDMHTFLIVYPSYGILHHKRNAWVFSSISHSMGEKTGKPIEWEKPGKLVPGKIIQNPSYVDNLGTFSHSIGDFLPLDSHHVLYFIICEIHGLPHQFPIAWENAAKSIELGEPGKLVPIFSPKYGYFSSVRFPSYGILHHMGNALLFPSIYNTTEKCSKIHPVSSQVVFPEYYLFYLFQNLVIP